MHTGVTTYGDNTFQVSIESVHVLQDLFHALCILLELDAGAVDGEGRMATLTTAISRTNSSRCCSKTVGVSARSPEPGVDEIHAMLCVSEASW